MIIELKLIPAQSLHSSVYITEPRICVHRNDVEQIPDIGLNRTWRDAFVYQPVNKDSYDMIHLKHGLVIQLAPSSPYLLFASRNSSSIQNVNRVKPVFF
jgi:hypothetical protein